MNLISKWLSGKRNFHVGVVLFKNYSKNEKLKKYFEGAADQIKQEKLQRELASLNEKPFMIVSAPALNKDQDEMPKATDPVMEAMRVEWLIPYQKMNQLRHELDRHQGDLPQVIATRSALAKEILELEQQCMVIWRRRDHYLETGKLPEVKDSMEKIPTDPFELAKLIQALEKNIRRNKSLAAKHPESSAYALRAKKYQETLDEVKKRIEGGKK